MGNDAKLSVRWLPDDGGRNDGWRRFELSSRGDRVVARLHTPADEGPHAVAVVLSADADQVEPVGGCATLTLDLPLLGERSSPKWTERLRRCLAEGPGGAADRALLEDFSTQAAHDVAATLDVCTALAGAATRVGLLGLGPGAFAAARLAEREPRIAAFVLAPAGLAPDLDPSPTLAGGGRPCVEASDAAEGAARLREALG